MPASRYILVIAAAGLAGCMGVQAVDGTRYSMSSETFRAYAEDVFRRQNAVLSDLTFRLDEGGLGLSARRQLEIAEEDLLVACAELNELAVSRRDGLDSGLGERWGTGRSVPVCERAVVAASALLERSRPRR